MANIALAMGSTRSFRARLALSGMALLTLSGCDSGRARTTPPAPAPVVAAPKPSTAGPLATETRAPELSPPKAVLPPKAARPLGEAEKDDNPVENSRFLLDGLNDVGPAAPSSAYAQGVIMVTRSDELSRAMLSQPPSKSKKPVPALIEPTRRGSADFWPVARGPGISATHAYWVSKGRLVRRGLTGGDLEVLASDARDGTRVAVVSSPDAVAYITRPADEKQDSRAMLRLADGKIVNVTPEGAAASSVTLARVGDDLIVGSIDGRSGMTPVHARRYRSKSGALEPDVVVWVAGATQGMTELSSTSDGESSWLLLPVEKDSSHFGLVTLALGPEPKMDPPLRWRTYENGLDRAPAAAALVCGATTAIYVRPADAQPTSNQELVVSELTLAESARSEIVATARGFADVSLYPLPEGAMLAYVADRRTWARLIRCK